jgi:hypothetical protein
MASASTTDCAAALYNSPGCLDNICCSASAQLNGDPHMVGAGGETADFRGEHNGIYNVLSAANLSMAVRIVHRPYHTPYSKMVVDGGWVHTVFWVARVPSGRLVHVEFSALVPREAIVVVGGQAVRVFSATPYRRENLEVVVSARTVSVATHAWTTRAESTIAYPHPNVLRINLKMQPRIPLSWSQVQPHGLLGQTFDGLPVPLFGLRDDYRKLPGKVTRTVAQAEGAIEGTADDYKLSGPFSTTFRYSRFNANAAPPRDVSRMIAAEDATAAAVTRGAPQWDANGGERNLVTGLNFGGADLQGLHARRSHVRTPAACYHACVQHLLCLAMTFISGRSSSARLCWLKGGGFQRGAAFSAGTISGVVEGWREKAVSAGRRG